MRRKPTDFSGMVYVSLMGGAPFIEKADKLVTFSAEFVELTQQRRYVSIHTLPNGAQILTLRATNRTVTYEVVRNEVVGCYYGELIEGDTTEGDTS